MSHGVVSADSHMTEPVDLWERRIDRRFRDRAPRVIENRSGEGPRFLLIAEGAPPFPIAGGFAAGRSGEELQELLGRLGLGFGMDVPEAPPRRSSSVIA